jgi:hypothetical protein
LRKANCATSFVHWLAQVSESLTTTRFAKSFENRPVLGYYFTSEGNG